MSLNREQPMRPFLDELADAFDGLPLEYVRAFDTVADMQAATDLQAGMVCHTNGFHTAGDDGAAFYAIGTTGTANGMDVLTVGELLATLVVTEPYVTPEQFGAYGDGTNDDVLMVQGSIDYATTKYLDVQFSVGKTYLVSAGINIGTVNVFMDSPIQYEGAGTAVNIGSQSTNIENMKFKLWVISGTSSYVSGSVGVQVYNAVNCKFIIHRISAFEHGVVFSGYNAGCAHNQINVTTIFNCMYPITLRSDGNNGYCNENYFYGGRLFVQSSASYAHSFVGITIDSDHEYYANANTFQEMSIEGAAICIHVIYGKLNKFMQIRSEGATYALVTENRSDFNYVLVSYGTVDSITTAPTDMVDGYTLNKSMFPVTVFDSGYISSYSFSNATNLFAGKDVACMLGSGNLALIPNATKYNNHINISTRNIGVMIDTTRAKKFYVDGMPYNNAAWRVFAICYDAEGNFIDTGLTSNQFRVLTVTNAISGSANIPVWRTGSSVTNGTAFEVPENCVKAFIGLINATDICGFKVFSDSQYAFVIGNQISNGLAAIPTCEGKSGDFCPSSAADNTLGWLYNGTEWIAIS